MPTGAEISRLASERRAVVAARWFAVVGGQRVQHHFGEPDESTLVRHPFAPGDSGWDGPEEPDDPDVTDAAAVSDEVLLRRCRAGDSLAWEVLVRRYEGLVLTAALEGGVSADEAADIKQSTFISLLESLASLRQDERIAAWLVTVTRRSAWRIRQHRSRELAVPAIVAHVDDALGDWEQTAWIRESLRRLPEPCRELLTALYLDPLGSSYRDVALRTGRAVGTIGPMRARCLHHLRRIMSEQAPS